MPQKVAIVGAGIVGSAIAWNLARAGAEVTVIERAHPGAGASGKSFGWINASFSETDEYFRLRRAAVDAYRGLAAEIGAPIPLVAGGSLWWEEEGRAFEAQARRLARLGYNARIIGSGEFAELEPQVAQPPERSIFAPSEAAVDGAALAAAFLAAASDLGAVLMIGAEVTGLLEAEGRIAGLATTFGRVQADETIIAAGAASEALLGTSGLRLPMDCRAGLILHTAPVAPVLRHVVLSPDIHFRQDPDGRIVAGEVFSGDGAGKDRITEDPAGLAAELLDRLRRRLPGIAGLDLGRIMLGERPVPKDGLPAIGRVGNAGGLYLATMHSGVTLAPLVGRLVATEIVEGAEADFLSSFRPARFG